MTANSKSVAFLVVALAAAAGCKKETAFERVQADVDGGQSASDPVQLAVTVAKSEVALGDDVVFHFKLTNSGKSNVTVNVPRIDQRSASFRVRRADGSTAMVTRNHAGMDQRGQFIYEAGDTKELGPGETLEQDVATVAVQAGKLAFTPSYARQGAPATLVVPTIEVTVAPADPEKSRLGVKIDTSEGPYAAVFRPDVAYNTVESFAALGKRGFFTGLKFHRIIKGFMAQGGDPQGEGGGGPGYFLPLEAKPDKLPHRRGVMSMARSQHPDSAGSQFFLMFKTDTELDKGRYTTFAEMTEGEETLKKLEDVKCGPGNQGEMSRPVAPVLIQRVQIVAMP